MLRIYDVALDMSPEIAALIEEVGKHNRQLKEQLSDCWPSVILNIAEGSGSEGGNRRLRYRNAKASANETLAGLEYSARVGYIKPLREALRSNFNHVIGVLVKNSRPSR